ncbi:hypothetical protein TPA0907_55790 [Micromonospora humidisoli]|uniref:DUF6093 family protein n=1 Tax=Micromonospora sp. AKA109 TaxID=2733865 RepID=UPI0022C4D814|nr:DUF6093 family protein [Micromonospora sp. AKA109]GHJ11212.1 hypothetical protein TPA0907_55790 [Micromonospora sp. AKA109]
MVVGSALARGRRAAERLMVDRCVVRRRTGDTSDDDGNITPTWQTVYPPPDGSGRCRLRQPTAMPRPDEAGEAVALMLRRELQLPISAVGVQADDVVTMTASRHDPDAAGRTFVVVGLHHASQATMRRLQVEERTS